MNNELEIILAIYRGMIAPNSENGIPICLRKASVVGTVQDDPFDCWVETRIKSFLPKSFDVFHSGKLTTPDLVIRDKESGMVVGIEIKKLIQKANGRDPRGLTIDYNSCLPCGKTIIKVGHDTVIIPCYYLFALLNSSSDHIVTLIILDGDFLNYDIDLHKESKYSNFTEYNHGPYGEGSVRHRKMYTYPNPLNSALSFFYLHQSLVVKKILLSGNDIGKNVSEEIVRNDRYGNSFFYSLIDETEKKLSTDSLSTLKDIFEGCKRRNPKERVAYMQEIPEL